MFHHRMPCSIPEGQYAAEAQANPRQRAGPAVTVSPATTFGRFLRPSSHLCCSLSIEFPFKHFPETSPLRNA